MYCAQEYGFPRWNVACGLCMADRSHSRMGFGEVRPDKATWIPTIHTAAGWLARFPDRNIIFDYLSLSQHNVCPDYMHSKHMGVDMYFVASVLMLLVYHMLPGTAQQNLDAVWK